MDQINRWWLDLSESPAGSIVLFVLVFIARVAIDQYSQKKAERHRKHRTRKPA